MKKIMDYTDEEKLALTDDEIDHLVDIECAEQGVKFLEAPTKIDRTSPPRDITIYSVAGVYFVDRAEAEKVAALINECATAELSYDWNIGSHNKYVKETSGDACVNLTTEQVFSRTQYEKFKVELKMIAKEKENYDEAIGEYDEQNERRNEIRREITDVIYEVQTVKDRRDWIGEEYDRYLALAENNAVVAMNFLRRAHAVDDNMVEELCSGYFGSPEKDIVENEGEEVKTDDDAG